MVNKLNIPTSVFATAINAIEKSIPAKSVIQSLLNVHFSLGKNHLTLTASDIVTMSSATIEFDVPFEFEPFDVLVDADKMVKFILSLNTDNVSVETDLENNKIVLRSSGRRTTLNTASTDEYIEMVFDEPEKRVDIDPGFFAEAVKKVSNYHLPANNPMLTISRGIELLVGADGFRASATDTFVGATYQFGDVQLNENQVVVMGDQLLDVSKALIGCDELHIGITDETDTKLFFYGYQGSVKIKTAIQVLSQRETFAKIYDYIKSIMAKSLIRVNISKSEMLNAIKPLDAYEDAHVLILVSKDNVKLIIEDSQIGEYSAEIICETENFTDDIAIKLDKKFMKRAFTNLSEEVSFYTNNDIPMVIFTPHDDDGSYYQGIGKIAF